MTQDKLTSLHKVLEQKGPHRKDFTKDIASFDFKRLQNWPPSAEAIWGELKMKMPFFCKLA